MSSEQINRGVRMREFRQKKNMTLRELSAATGISVGFLSKIEKGIGNPSVSNINKICYALDITTNDLMTPKKHCELKSSDLEHSSYILHKSERCLLYNFSDMIRFESIFEGNPHFKLNVLTLSGNNEDSSMPISNTSIHSYDEFGIIAKGKLIIILENDKKHTLTEGDCIMIRANIHHTVIAISTEECVSYWIEMPETDAK